MKLRVQGYGRGFTCHWDLSGVGLLDLLDYIAEELDGVLDRDIIIRSHTKTLRIPKGKFQIIRSRVAREFGYL